jgi:hypothetical protein
MATTISKQIIVDLRPLIEAALKLVADKFGIEIKTGKGGYTDGSTGDLKLELKVAGADVEAENWNAFAAIYGLDETWLGKTFTRKGVTLTITGLRSGRSSFNVAIRSGDRPAGYMKHDAIKRLMTASTA